MRTTYLTPDALADVVGAGRLSAAAPPPQTIALVDPDAAPRRLEVLVAGTAVTVCLATEATLGAGAAAVTFTAAATGPTVALVDPDAASRDLAVDVDGSAVTVTLATAPAAATLGAGDAAVTFTGGRVTVALVDPDAASRDLAVDVDGSAVTVTLATDATEAVTTTADDVVAAVNADQSASALVTAALPDGADGTGVVAPAATTALAGGGDVITTAADVVAAVNADQSASALVTAALPDGADGTGVVAPVASTALAGGGDVTTTAADVVTAITDDQAASALMTAARPTSCADAGVVAPAPATAVSPQATLGMGSAAVTFASVPPYDAARVQRALDDVADRIDGRIRRRYAVPLEDVPGFLARAAAWCALGILVDETTGTDLIAARAEEGWQLVADIANGKIRIGGDLDGDPGANAPTRAGRAVLVYRNSPYSPSNTKGII